VRMKIPSIRPFVFLEVAKYSVPQSDIDNWGTPLSLTSSSAGVVDEKSPYHSSREPAATFYYAANAAAGAGPGSQGPATSGANSMIWSEPHTPQRRWADVETVSQLRQ
jgi:hypothetical protein